MQQQVQFYNQLLTSAHAKTKGFAHPWRKTMPKIVLTAVRTNLVFCHALVRMDMLELSVMQTSMLAKKISSLVTRV